VFDAVSCSLVHKFVNNFLPKSVCDKLIKLASTSGKNSLPNNGYFKGERNRVARNSSFLLFKMIILKKRLMVIVL
jgi:hypothetical protein